MKLLSSSIKKIAIFRALQLGDMLCLIPAVRALRIAYPEANITLLGLPWAKLLINRFPQYFDEFIHFPGYPGLPEQPFIPKDFLYFLSIVQQHHYDLVLQMQGNGTLVNPMIDLFGAITTAGFFYKDEYYPPSGLFIEYPESGHEIERHLKLINHMGIESVGTHLEFPIFDSDLSEFKELNLPVIAGNFVCIHPGSRGAWRQWPAQNFAALADHCAARGLQIIITGTRDELDIANEVRSFMQYDPIITAGKTSLGALAVLITNACMLISNCTGVSHIAAATKTPSIVISMDGEPERWGPINHDLHRTIDWTKNDDDKFVLSELQNLLKVYWKID